MRSDEVINNISVTGDLRGGNQDMETNLDESVIRV